MQQLSTSERRELSKYALFVRWHPREAQATKEKANKIAYLVREALKHPTQH